MMGGKLRTGWVGRKTDTYRGDERKGGELIGKRESFSRTLEFICIRSSVRRKISLSKYRIIRPLKVKSLDVFPVFKQRPDIIKTCNFPKEITSPLECVIRRDRTRPSHRFCSHQHIGLFLMESAMQTCPKRITRPLDVPHN